MTGGAFVPDLVEILFDLVPALRAARQTYCIRLAESSAHAETMAGGLADASTAAAVVSSDNVERKLDVFGETLGKRDQIPTKREKAARLYSRIFRRVKDV